MLHYRDIEVQKRRSRQHWWWVNTDVSLHKEWF